MVVDDESDILEQVKTCLEEDNFHVVTADNSRIALEMLEEHNEQDVGLLLIGYLDFQFRPGIGC